MMKLILIYLNICSVDVFQKKRNIELYKLGIILYKKRMDIINVFTLLLFSEKTA